MEKSETISEIAKALCKFQLDCPAIQLNKEVEVQTKKGGKYKFKYATLHNVLETITPVLCENGLAFSQILDQNNSITTIIMHSSGEYFAGNKSLDLPSELTAQEVGSFITYYKRYSLLAMLGIVAEDDEDGNGASGNIVTKQLEINWMKEKQLNEILLINEKDRLIKGLEYWQSENRRLKKEYREKIERKINQL